MTQVYVAVTENGDIISASSTPEKAKESIEKYFGTEYKFSYKDVRDSGIEFIAYATSSEFGKEIVTVQELTLDEL